MAARTASAHCATTIHRTSSNPLSCFLRLQQWPLRQRRDICPQTWPGSFLWLWWAIQWHLWSHGVHTFITISFQALRHCDVSSYSLISSLSLFPIVSALYHWNSLQSPTKPYPLLLKIRDCITSQKEIIFSPTSFRFYWQSQILKYTFLQLPWHSGVFILFTDSLLQRSLESVHVFFFFLGIIYTLLNHK